MLPTYYIHPLHAHIYSTHTSLHIPTPHTHTQMSLFFMWGIAKQKSHVDRTNILETLIQLASSCLELNNFASYMQLVSSLQHSSVNKFKTAWELVSKPVS